MREHSLQTKDTLTQHTATHSTGVPHFLGDLEVVLCVASLAQHVHKLLVMGDDDQLEVLLPASVPVGSNHKEQMCYMEEATGQVGLSGRDAGKILLYITGEPFLAWHSGIVGGRPVVPSHRDKAMQSENSYFFHEKISCLRRGSNT